MAGADRFGLPIAIHIASASLHDVTRVEATLAANVIDTAPEPVIGDKAYDSYPLDARLAADGIELIAPHRRGRKKPATQDGRPLRRYNRRWKIERLYAWLQNFRRRVVRYEFYPEHVRAFVVRGCVRILMRQYV